MSFKIYVLKDPITKKVRYVGQTYNRLSTRLSGHVSNSRNYRCKSNNEKVKWINDLFEKGYYPIIKCVEIVTEDEIDKKELEWIAYYKEKGCKLLNKHKMPESTQSGGTFTEVKTFKKKISEADRKVNVSVWPKNVLVEAIGGFEKARAISLQALEKEYAKIILEKDLNLIVSERI